MRAIWNSLKDVHILHYKRFWSSILKIPAVFSFNKNTWNYFDKNHKWRSYLLKTTWEFPAVYKCFIRQLFNKSCLCISFKASSTYELYTKSAGFISYWSSILCISYITTPNSWSGRRLIDVSMEIIGLWKQNMKICQLSNQFMPD